MDGVVKCKAVGRIYDLRIPGGASDQADPIMEVGSHIRSCALSTPDVLQPTVSSSLRTCNQVEPSGPVNHSDPQSLGTRG